MGYKFQVLLNLNPLIFLFDYFNTWEKNTRNSKYTIYFQQIIFNKRKLFDLITVKC